MTTSTSMASEKLHDDRTAAGCYLSVAIRADGWPCLVVGGGRVGARKAATLVRAGARVTVLSLEFSPRLRAMAERGQIQWRHGPYAPSEMRGFRLVVAATADAALNLRIGRDAERQGILSCTVSSARDSRVIFPAVYDDGDVAVAVHSRGRDCRKSQIVRDRISIWLSASRQPPGDGNRTPVRNDRRNMREESPRAPGKVSIVGAGPGAADLISVRGYHALRSADAILMDELIPGTFLEELGISATGKTMERLGRDGHHWSQEEINGWLVAAAASGRAVVRLKGGDPFVFGRGDSELDALAEHGIAWEVIPGPSSATAVLGDSGLPLTRHARGRSFAVATARVEGGRVAESFPRADSLVILMGVTALDQVVTRLLADGWPPATPAAMVERGTLAWERRVSGPISQLAELARKGNIASPAIVAVGEAARSIVAFRRRPTILYTGLDAANFRMLGNVLHWPAQAIVPNAEGCRLFPHALTAIERGNLGWVVFTDKFAVRSFCAALDEHGRDARVLGGVRLATIGDETLRQLQRQSLRVDATIAEDELLDPSAAMGDVREQGILVVQGSHAPRGLCEKLEDAGATVGPLVLNRLVPHSELGRQLPEHDVIYFVSPAGVRAYARAYGSAAFQREAWCLGEATQQALAARGAAAAIVRPRLLSPPCLTR